MKIEISKKKAGTRLSFFLWFSHNKVFSFYVTIQPHTTIGMLVPRYVILSEKNFEEIFESKNLVFLPATHLYLFSLSDRKVSEGDLAYHSRNENHVLSY